MSAVVAYEPATAWERLRAVAGLGYHEAPGSWQRPWMGPELIVPAKRERWRMAWVCLPFWLAALVVDAELDRAEAYVRGLA